MYPKFYYGLDPRVIVKIYYCQHCAKKQMDHSSYWEEEMKGLLIFYPYVWKSRPSAVTIKVIVMNNLALRNTATQQYRELHWIFKFHFTCGSCWPFPHLTDVYSNKKSKNLCWSLFSCRRLPPTLYKNKHITTLSLYITQPITHLRYHVE